MTVQTSTIRPGLLVALKTTVIGNVRYAKVILQNDTEDDAGGLQARWETERYIAAPKEHEEAQRIRSKARKTIARVCSLTAFGLLCPVLKAGELEEAVEAARIEANAFNAKAQLTRIDIAIITGRIAADDVEAIRAINSEVKDLLAAMEQGVARLDPAAIREAASRARSVSQMLSPVAQERISEAIDAARSAARKLSKAGEVAGEEVATEAIAAITSARTAFLDLETTAVEIAVPEADGRAVDLDPDVAVACAEYVAEARQVELN